MNQTFAGQVALITGGGKGIGLAIAKSLVARGANVIITGRHKNALDKAVAELMNNASALEMDVRDEDSVARGIFEAIRAGGALDIVVNNAGIGLLETPLMETESRAWRDVIETNLTGSFFVARSAWPHLIKSKGQLLNISSIAGTQGFRGASAYCASKFGLNGLTEVLKVEGESAGVRVLAICPGAIATDIWGDWADEDTKSRMMTAEQIGELAAGMLSTPRNIDLGKWVITNAVSPWK